MTDSNAEPHSSVVLVGGRPTLVPLHRQQAIALGFTVLDAPAPDGEYLPTVAIARPGSLGPLSELVHADPVRKMMPADATLIEMIRAEQGAVAWPDVIRPVTQPSSVTIAFEPPETGLVESTTNAARIAVRDDSEWETQPASVIDQRDTAREGFSWPSDDSFDRRLNDEPDEESIDEQMGFSPILTAGNLESLRPDLLELNDLPLLQSTTSIDVELTELADARLADSGLDSAVQDSAVQDPEPENPSHRVAGFDESNQPQAETTWPISIPDVAGVKAPAWSVAASVPVPKQGTELLQPIVEPVVEGHRDDPFVTFGSPLTRSDAALSVLEGRAGDEDVVLPVWPTIEPGASVGSPTFPAGNQLPPKKRRETATTVLLPKKTHTDAAGQVPAISIRGISRSYRSPVGDIHVLNHIDLDLAPGDLVVISGASGSGISTLLHCLAGFDLVDSGRMYCNGDEMGAWSESDRARFRAAASGFIPQNLDLVDDLNVRDNAALPLLAAGWTTAAAHDEVARILTDLRLESRLFFFPSQLSRSERALTTVARALAGNPFVIWADDPTAGLDEDQTELVSALLLSHHQRGATVVIGSRDPRFTRAAGRNVLLRNGRLTDQSTSLRWGN